MPKRGNPPIQGELLQGTLDLLVLKTLVLGPAHGHTIAHAIEHQSEDVLQVEHGSLYPALHRLEDRGWIASFWGTSENNRRARYYRLTPKGRQQLAAQTNRWDELVRAVNRILRPARTERTGHELATLLPPARTGTTSARASSRRISTIEIDENIARGLSPDDARDGRAIASSGNPTRIREEIYDMNTLGLARDLLAGPALRRAPAAAQPDLRDRRDPVARARRGREHRDLPAGRRGAAARRCRSNDPTELVEIRIDTTRQRAHGAVHRPTAAHDESAVARRARAAAGLLGNASPGAPRRSTWPTAASPGPRRGSGSAAISSDARRAGRAVGRVLTPDDDRSGCARTGRRSEPRVLAATVRRRSVGRSGSAIVLDGHPFDIVGVAPAGFFGVDVGRTFDVAAPICAEPITRGARSGLDKRDVWFLDVLGRLRARAGRSERAEAQLQSISPSLFQATAPPTLTPADTTKLPRVQIDCPIRPDRRVVGPRAPTRLRSGSCSASRPSCC